MIDDSEKLTDTFGRIHNYLRISVTDHCNLRCSYCMPDENMVFTPNKRLMQVAEIIEIAHLFTQFGINKIRITGGEPLLRKGISEILYGLSKLPVELTLTTNATLVHHYIDVLKDCSIRSINISLDTFERKKFYEISRRDEFERVMTNIRMLIQNKLHIKLNVVIIRNFNEHEIPAFIEFTRNNPVEIRFIEFMPFPGNNWQKEDVVSKTEILEMVENQFEVTKIVDPEHATSSGYQIDGFKGSFGIISTVTAPFCGSCNRLRLTADGKIKNCLFSKGELDLLTAFRSGESIEHLIRTAVLSKKHAFGGQDLFQTTHNRSMIAIGG
jgi:cyclic pyranopterin phosphate synthase